MAPVRVFTLPRDDRRDTVSITDMDRSFGLHPLRALFKRPDAPLLHRVEIDIETRLVELHDIAPVLRQLTRLFIHQPGQFARQLPTLPVVLIRNRIGDGHRSGQSDFDRLCRVLFHKPEGLNQHRPRPTQLLNHPGGPDLDTVAVPPRFDLNQTAEVQPGQPFNEPPDIMPPALFTVGHDIEAGRFLVGKREQHRIVLALTQHIALQLPRDIHGLWGNEPGRAG